MNFYNTGQQGSNMGELVANMLMIHFLDIQGSSSIDLKLRPRCLGMFDFIHSIFSSSGNPRDDIAKPQQRRKMTTVS